MNRTVFLVDGFNLYHSVRSASEDLGGKSTKWSDIRSLLSSYLPAIGAGAVLHGIYYFSALAVHLEQYKPDVVARHRLFLDCLVAAGIVPILGRFKFKTVRCHACNRDNPHYEEKETDVAISMKLIEVFQKDEADTAVLVTGDTDLAPAVRTASLLFPAKQICFAFPYKRKNRELSRLVPKSLYIRKERYTTHQFPDPFTMPNGRKISKPVSW
ncbi:MAG: NYN domain-containing protein [Candidatus Eisenbacteria bacterium]|nr:NYN domain-containing protein [Candidatus Eisenbacteria bacterium]